MKTRRKVKKEKHKNPWHAPCIIMASGPSLGWDDYADVELARESGFKTIVVNSTFRYALWADAIYAGDGAWWKANHEKVPDSMEKWCCSKAPAILFGAKYKARATKKGYNSGACAIELAANVYKANPIILIGFDASTKHGIHHHPDHKATSNPTEDRAVRWLDQYLSITDKLNGAEVLNCSRFTRLDMFKKADFKETLEKYK